MLWHYAPLGGTTGESWNYSFLLFQTVFAATAATIVSGAMAERTKFLGYLVYSFFISILIYPIFGGWAWGSLLLGGPAGGWLENLDTAFCDFAGSTVVHSVGGWLALAGAIMLGPRLGKYGPDKKPRAIVGHNIPLAALGVFILWFGWFGFNAGSTTTGDLSIGRIAVTTNIAAAGGAVAAMLTAWVIFRKPDASMTLNGALAGRIPVYSKNPKAKRLEFRCPDPTANGYLAWTGMMMAALDGIANRIDPGDPLDVDIYDLSDDELAKYPHTPGSLTEAIDALASDHAFLTVGNVFTNDVVEAWIGWKREEEIEPMALRPHPYEFHMYYDS